MTRDEAASEVVTQVLAYEGGIATLPGESFETRFGQTPAWLETFGLRPPKNAHEAVNNYRTWLVRTGLIGVCEYPDAFALSVIDWAVHAGHMPAIKALQTRLGIQPDGIFGPETQAAVDKAERTVMARRMVAARLRSLGKLIASKPERYGVYASGWSNRIADQIEKLL